MTRRVLLIDDDEDFRALLVTALAAHGLTTIEATTGADADEALALPDVGVVVVDALLPGLAQRLTPLDRAVRIVCVSQTVRDVSGFRSLTEGLGLAMVLYKPVDPAEFAAKVAQLVGAPASDAPGATGLGELRRQFGTRLPEKLAALEQAITEAKGDPSALVRARTLAHRLRGSAGSYGYLAVGDAIAGLEDILASGASSPHRLPRYFFESLEGALREAQLAVGRAPDTRDGDSGIEQAPKSLLVVDDDPIVLHLAKAAGRRLAVSVTTAQSTDEALQRASSTRLMGAILDVHLDTEDSFSLARRIRQTPHNADIPIAFASVDSRIETRVAALEAGGMRFFDKPISDEVLGLLLQEFASLSQARQGRVLIVDDDPDVVVQYAKHLAKAGYAVDSLPSADTLVERLDGTRPDVVLLDVNLPRVSGIDVCRALRASERWEFLPVLMVTAAADVETRLKAFRAGASDVVTKPVVKEELLARVSVQAERMRLSRERADKDALSGLLLRRAFIEAFHRALASCTRDGKPLSIVLIDLDHFKRINDTQGHLAGDQVIARLGDLLRRRFRVEDLRGRWGGEEFLLAFPGASPEFATQATRRLLADFSALPFMGSTGPFTPTFSAGVASFPEDGTSMSALVRRADELLYVGKREGRARVIDGVTGEALRHA